MADRKWWSATLGLGTLDYGPKVATFTPDNGAAAIKIPWVVSLTGQGTAMPRRKAERAEWDRWLTFKDARGVSFSFRRDGAPAGGA